VLVHFALCIHSLAHSFIHPLPRTLLGSCSRYRVSGPVTGVLLALRKSFKEPLNSVGKLQNPHALASKLPTLTQHRPLLLLLRMKQSITPHGQVA
jgi:hypothetical protein